MSAPPKFIPLRDFEDVGRAEMLARAARFNALLQRRRTVRTFCDRPVACAVIEHCLAAAASSPSGANLQYPTFTASPSVATFIEP
jgi:iodotyrosine deiodinase